jgi:manganese/zinc/iron transport system permease protein
MIEIGYTLRTVLLGAAILGAVGGVLGSFAVLRRQSLVGDALAHAALPGVCLAFLVTGLREPLPLMLGAALSGLAGALALLAIVRGSRIKEDAALGIVLSVSFGFGTLLLTRIQHQGDAAQSGLDRFLFGQAATLLERDVATMAVLAAVVLLVVWALFKELKLLTFDPDFAAVVGYPVTGLSVGLTALLVAAVAIGLQAVGVILMVALLIAPPVAARQWTRSLGAMALLAGAIGAASGVAGTLVSAGAADVPTGPAIVLAATACAAVSVLFAPERGVVWRARRRAALAARRAPEAAA